MSEINPLLTDEYTRKLQAVISQLPTKAELLVFSQSTHSVPEAAAAAGVRHEDFVKNICLITAEGELVVAIVKGEDRVSHDLAARAAGTRKVRLATPEEILEKTGFPCGGTPSFGFPARVLIDPRVMEMELVYTGGGSEHALMRCSPQEIVRFSGGQVVSLRKGAV